MPRGYQAPQAYANHKRPHIGLTPVKSSQVKSVGYDDSTKTLAVQFCHGAGAIYHYPDVTREQYEAFINAESIGVHFGKHIKQLPFTKYHPDPAPTAQVTAHHPV